MFNYMPQTAYGKIWQWMVASDQRHTLATLPLQIVCLVQIRWEAGWAPELIWMLQRGETFLVPGKNQTYASRPTLQPSRYSKWATQLLLNYIRLQSMSTLQCPGLLHHGSPAAGTQHCGGMCSHNIQGFLHWLLKQVVPLIYICNHVSDYRTKLQISKGVLLSLADCLR
jgi:hypothetical protein